MQKLNEDNVHNIPTEMIEDYLGLRKAKKAPLSLTAWNKINKELGKCDDPIKAFEIMITHGWVGLKAEWIKNLSSKKSTSINSSINHQDISWIHGESL